MINFELHVRSAVLVLLYIRTKKQLRKNLEVLTHLQWLKNIV